MGFNSAFKGLKFEINHSVNIKKYPTRLYLICNIFPSLLPNTAYIDTIYSVPTSKKPSSTLYIIYSYCALHCAFLISRRKYFFFFNVSLCRQITFLAVLKNLSKMMMMIIIIIVIIIITWDMFITTDNKN
jgi:hypothetical protein